MPELPDIEAFKKKLHDLLTEKDDLSNDDLIYLRQEGKELGIDERNLSKLLQEVYLSINNEKQAQQTEKNHNNKIKFERNIIRHIKKGSVTAKYLADKFKDPKNPFKDIDELAIKIKEFLDNNDYKQHPEANSVLPLKDLLSAANWYSPKNYQEYFLSKSPFEENVFAVESLNPENHNEKVDKSLQQSATDKRGVSLNKKVFIRALILIVTSIIFLFIICNTKYACKDCNVKFFDISFYFNFFIIFIFVCFIIRLIINESHRKWKNQPHFIKILFICISISSSSILFIWAYEIYYYEKYQKIEQQSWYWPANILKFPMEQMQLYDSSSTLISNIHIDSLNADAINKRILYITIVDRTISSADIDSTKQTATQIKNACIACIANYGFQIDSTTNIRDLICGTLNFNIEETSLPFISSFIYVYNGLAGKDTFLYDDLLSREKAFKNSKPINIKNYFDICKVFDKDGDRKNARTDFCDMFKNSLKCINDTGFSYDNADVYLNVISDFCHDESSDDISKPEISFDQVNRSIKDFLYNKGRWDVKQINLYKLPLSSKKKSQAKYKQEKEDVKKMFRIFKKKCKQTIIHDYDIDHYISQNQNPLLIGNNVPYSPYNHKPIAFYNKQDAKVTESNIRLCFSSLAKIDDLSYCLYDENAILNDDGDYEYNCIITDNKNNDLKINGDINVNYNKEKIASETIFKIYFDKTNISDNAFFLEIYSKKNRSKVRIPICFLPVLPEYIVSFLLVLYSIFYFSSLLYMLLIMHFAYIHKEVKEKTRISEKTVLFYSILCATILLFILLAIGLILFIKIISYYHLQISIKLFLFSLLVILHVLIINWYRRYISLYLFHNGIKDRKHLHTLLGGLFMNSDNQSPVESQI